MSRALDAAASGHIDAALGRAASFLARRQLGNGEFELRVANDRALKGPNRADGSIFATVFIVIALRRLPYPWIEAHIERARRFLIGQMRDPGIWKFWTTENTAWGHVDYDVDDSVLASYVCRDHNLRLGLGRNVSTLLKNRDTTGVFKTWLRPAGRTNQIDSVVNANAMLYFARRPDVTSPCCAYLREILLSDQELGGTPFYDHPLALYSALARARAEGVAELDTLGDLVTGKARACWAGASIEPLHAALAGLTFVYFGQAREPVVADIVEHLLATQQVDGSWPAAGFCCGPEPPSPRSLWWGSTSLTTGFVVELLAGIKKNPA